MTADNAPKNQPRIFADAGSPRPGAWDDAEQALDEFEDDYDPFEFEKAFREFEERRNGIAP